MRNSKKNGRNRGFILRNESSHIPPPLSGAIKSPTKSGLPRKPSPLTHRAPVCPKPPKCTVMRQIPPKMDSSNPIESARRTTWWNVTVSASQQSNGDQQREGRGGRDGERKRQRERMRRDETGERGEPGVDREGQHTEGVNEGSGIGGEVSKPIAIRCDAATRTFFVGSAFRAKCYLLCIYLLSIFYCLPGIVTSWGGGRLMEALPPI